ncbi:alkaline phosphatase PhoD [Nocardioides marinquilinus]|uniref:Alkaline phosphatase PhoD n=1 Tax=Nocardioides marinquilinus TaxID=1210400 RepID=A0ABP9Q2Z7_9ACTN
MTSRTPLSAPTTRRTVLATTAVAGGLGTAAVTGLADQRATAAAAPLRRDPFTLGVASGDPSPDGFVIWTRLAPRPLADDGLGGMPSRRQEVRWEVAVDERFRLVVKRGTVRAEPRSAHAVHVEVAGLAPGREYFYRFRVGRWVSRSGRALTAPEPGTLPASLAMSFVSCSQFEHGFFTAYRRLAEDHPDLVLHLGDYQYEYKRDDYVSPTGNVRDHRGPETTTLAGYRQRHAQYKTDADLQEAHAVAPWLVVWDDHELDNNWADETPENPESVPGFLQRRVAAFRAYYENMPLRRTSVPVGIDMQLYRRVRWGQLATFHMLDTRQFRDDQACGDGYDDCPEASDPARTITGAEQEQWLLDGFRESTARWDVLGQQVFFSQRDNDAGPATVTSMDSWDGYVASRERITQGWLDARVRNPVVLTGDVHAHWASEIKQDFADPDGPSIGTELVCSSITSGGDGADEPTGSHPWFPQNPHLKFWNNLRGYVNTTITPTRLDADFRCLPKVTRPGTKAFTRRSYAIEDGDRTLHQTADHPSTSRTLRSRGITPADVVRETVAQETAG